MTMPSSTSSVGRYPSLSLYSSYSSYPSYKSAGSTSASYLNRTTSLDRSYSASSGASSYFRYSGGTKALSTLPPRPTYSTSTDTYRSSRSVRVSPNRSSFSRLSSDSSLDRETSSRYSSLSRPPRDYSASRESGYYTSSSSYLPRSSVDYSNANGDLSRRSSLYRRDSATSTEDDSMRVSERIRALEGWRDPVEERLAQRRRRLGLSPSRDSGSRSPRPRPGLREDNRRAGAYDEENGNESSGEARPSVTELCRMYNSNLNIVNGDASTLHELSGCSGGAGPCLALKDPSIGDRTPRSRQDSFKDGKDSPLDSPKTARRCSPKPRSPPRKDLDDLSKVEFL